MAPCKHLCGPGTACGSQPRTLHLELPLRGAKALVKLVVVVVVTLPWLSSKLVVGALGKPL